MKSHDTTCDRALEFAAVGARVVPVDECGRPLIALWHHRASNSAARVREWWARWPDALIGIATGRRSITILRAHGELAEHALRKFEREHGPLPRGPQLACAELHDRFYFFQGRGSRLPALSALGPGLVVYGDGALVVMPPIAQPEAA